MWDAKAAFITGAVTTSKVRVLWRDGTLRCFNHIGKVLEIKSEQPTRKRGHIRTWSAVTEHGDITITEKCWTCGGWWRVAGVEAEALWRQGD